MEISFPRFTVRYSIFKYTIYYVNKIFAAGSKPFVLTVVTNDNDMDDVGNRGFELNYAQQACSISRFGTVG